MQQKLLFLQIVYRFEAGAIFQIHFPNRVIRIDVSFDFEVSFDGNPLGLKEVNPSGFSFWVADFSAEDPGSMAQPREIFLPYPTSRFARMSSFRPAPQGQKDGVVYFDESLFTTDVPMIGRPASDEGVELTD